MSKLILMTGIAVMATLLLSTSCSDANADSNPASDRIASDILDLDYKQAVDACRISTFDSSDEEKTGFTGWWLDGMEGCVGKGVPDRPLTASEKQRLGLWVLPDGSATFWSAIITELYLYHEEHGVLPQSGVALYPELRGSEGYSTLIALGDEEVLNRFPEGIDPITGKFYSSYSSEEWCSGTMNVTLVEDASEIAELYPDLYIPSSSDEESKGIKRPAMVWHVVIYGEAEGSILLDDIVVM